MLIWRLCLIVLTVALLGSACDSEDEVKINEIESSIVEGIDRQAVENFFQEQGIDYAFVPRSQVDDEVPPFEWKSPDAIGIYAGLIRDTKTRWLMLASEHISIEVEIDSRDQVSQVVVKRAYTAP